MTRRAARAQFGLAAVFVALQREADSPPWRDDERVSEDPSTLGNGVSCTPTVIIERYFDDPNEEFEWEVAYLECTDSEPDHDRYSVYLTLQDKQGPREGWDPIGFEKWGGASLGEIRDRIGVFFSSENVPASLGAGFEWSPPREVVDGIPHLDSVRTALLLNWTDEFCRNPEMDELFQLSAATCEELQRQDIALDPHHETMLFETVIDNGGSPPEAVNMIATLRRAEELS